MLNKATQPTLVIGLALALAVGATTPGFAKKRHMQDPTAAQNSVSAGNSSVPGSRPTTSPENSQQAQCWIPVDDDRGYGYQAGCDRPRARQMK